jgi:hypothetical protein
MLQSGSMIPMLEKVQNKFIFAFSPVFNTRYLPIQEPYILTVLGKDVNMWITNPALFLFIECDNLTPLTTSPNRVTIVETNIFELPKVEFKKPDKKFDNIFCVTDFLFNRNISSDEELNGQIVKLTEIKQRLFDFFK